MPKRLAIRSVKTSRTYTIDEAAELTGVSIGTVRSWVKSGLPIMTAKRPFLILGDALRNFLQDRRAKSKTYLQADQLYCLGCKAGRRPLGLMVDVYFQTTKTARLTGLCDTCGGTCNRMISRAKLDQFAEIFDLAFNAANEA